jgi:hypothetical protein
MHSEPAQSEEAFSRACFWGFNLLLSVLGLGGVALVATGLFVSQSTDSEAFLVIGGSVLSGLSFGCIFVGLCIFYAFANPDEAEEEDNAMGEHPLLPT